MIFYQRLRVLFIKNDTFFFFDSKMLQNIHLYYIMLHKITIKSFNTRYPKDWGCNSPFCVDDINRGAVAWIYDFNYHNKKSVCVYAGINPFDFVEKIKEIEANNPDWHYSPDDYDEENY